MKIVVGLIHLQNGERVYKNIRLQEDGSGIIHYQGRCICLEYVGCTFPYWKEQNDENC